MIKTIVFFVFVFPVQSKKIENFQLPVYGQEKIFHLDEVLKKHDRILLNFWASWCGDCIREIDELEALKKSHKDIFFVGINAGEADKKIKRFLKKYDFSYLILKDKDRKISKKMNVTKLPTNLVIDKEKRILFNENRPPKTIP